MPVLMTFIYAIREMWMNEKLHSDITITNFILPTKRIGINIDVTIYSKCKYRYHCEWDWITNKHFTFFTEHCLLTLVPQIHQRLSTHRPLPTLKDGRLPSIKFLTIYGLLDMLDEYKWVRYFSIVKFYEAVGSFFSKKYKLILMVLLRSNSLHDGLH